MKAIVYARSAKRQTKKRKPIEEQVKACSRYARENDLQVSKVYTDAGYSGANLSRPGLTKMREVIARTQIGVVIVHDLCRLTRSFRDKLILDDEFARHGTRICIAHKKGTVQR